VQPGTVAAPPEGLWRIHRDPTALPQRPGPGEQPPNRFDDPRGDYRVRYLATNRRGAFLEVLARFRRSPETEERLGGVTEVDDALEPALPASVPPVLLQAAGAVAAGRGAVVAVSGRASYGPAREPTTAEVRAWAPSGRACRRRPRTAAG